MFHQPKDLAAERRFRPTLPPNQPSVLRSERSPQCLGVFGSGSSHET